MEGIGYSQAKKVEARLKLVTAMQAGTDWHTAAQAAQLTTSRSTAYRYLKNFKDKGEVALRDGRQGHPSKFKVELQRWIVDYCRANPSITSRQVQVAIETRFALTVSITRLNEIRAALGITNQPNLPNSLASIALEEKQAKKKQLQK